MLIVQCHVYSLDAYIYIFTKPHIPSGFLVMLSSLCGTFFLTMSPGAIIKYPVPVPSAFQI